MNPPAFILSFDRRYSATSGGGRAIRGHRNAATAIERDQPRDHDGRFATAYSDGMESLLLADRPVRATLRYPIPHELAMGSSWTIDTNWWCVKAAVFGFEIRMIPTAGSQPTLPQRSRANPASFRTPTQYTAARATATPQTSRRLDRTPGQKFEQLRDGRSHFVRPCATRVFKSPRSVPVAHGLVRDRYTATVMVTRSRRVSAATALTDLQRQYTPGQGFEPRSDVLARCARPL